MTEKALFHIIITGGAFIAPLAMWLINSIFLNSKIMLYIIRISSIIIGISFISLVWINQLFMVPAKMAPADMQIALDAILGLSLAIPFTFVKEY